MTIPWFRAGGVLLVLALLGRANLPVRADIPDDLKSLQSRPDRATWDRLVSAGPTALVPILNAWPVDHPVLGHWLRSAFDRIVDNHFANHLVRAASNTSSNTSPADKTAAESAGLPIAEFQAFLADHTKPGPARRLALTVLDRVRPGTRETFLAQALRDPEFGPDAVDALVRAAETTPEPRATALLQQAFAATTTVTTAFELAKKLKARGVSVDPLAQLGILSAWQVVGPFPVSPEEGLKTAFPPERGGKLPDSTGRDSGSLAWRAAVVDPLDGKLDLVKQGIRPDQGAVAYAVARFRPREAGEVVLYAAAVDNLTVWINGTKVVERADPYRAQYRTDRYSARVRLPAEESQILVKLVKTRPEEVAGRGEQRGGGPPLRWDFQVRLTRPDGSAVAGLTAPTPPPAPPDPSTPPREDRP